MSQTGMDSVKVPSSIVLAPVLARTGNSAAA
jgi:hypothetical protein